MMRYAHVYMYLEVLLGQRRVAVHVEAAIDQVGDLVLPLLPNVPILRDILQN